VGRPRPEARVVRVDGEQVQQRQQVRQVERRHRGESVEQGIALVHISAQRKRFLWDGGCT